MSLVNIEIFNIGRTMVDRKEVQKWLGYLEAHNFEIPDEETVSDPALLIALAGKRCYKSFEIGLNPNITQIRQDYTKYFDNILSSRHGSVLEHSVYSYAIEGVSRVFTAEMNRHRAGMAISEGSLRFIRFDKDIPYWLPTSISEKDENNPDLYRRKKATRELFEKAFLNQTKLYAEGLAIWHMEEGHHNFHYKKNITSLLRRIIGMGVATGGVWSGNIRALRHIISMRTDAAAEEEIFYVFDKIAKDIIAKEPLLFGDFEHKDDNSWKPRNWKV